MKSNYLFSQVPSVQIQRSVFDRSHNYKTTMNGDYLYPIYVDEVYPGDSVKMRVNMFARMATQVVPLLDNCYIDVFAFFVPRRLVWEHWQNFMGEKVNPSDTTEYLLPKCVSKPSSIGTDAGFGSLSLYDYMGVPTKVLDTWIDACYPRAYNLIYNEWFRDENLINSLDVPTDDGPDYSGEFTLQKRAKAHDYFTSCLPWPQKGSASQINLGGYAPVVFTADDLGTVTESGNSFTCRDLFNRCRAIGFGPGIGGSYQSISPINNNSTLGSWNYTYSALSADLSTASGISINQLRMSYQFQRLLERDARGGTRYTEIIRSHFGVVSPDARLQRPEFLGMFSTKVNIQAIAQNSSTDATSPQANLAAIGVASGTSNYIVKSFVEHGIIMFLANIRGDVNYDQGMPRIFSRRTRNDFYWPAYAHLGEQAVLNKEIFCQGDSVKVGTAITDEQVFGYIPRYDELRFSKNEITGQLRGNYSTTLNYWTLTEKFASLPGLNQTFIEQATPFSRSQAVSSDPTFLVDLWFESKWARPMPTFGVPGWVDHF